ncbi:MAG: thioredoxin [Actinobacteria bacterium]|nr:thioredoxin [Actinomycetota bacterium]MCW3043310.1 thioredoxin [Actinomycetota bacterium]MEA2592056.1 thioredoxin 2 [Actinomycetota bacterium]
MPGAATVVRCERCGTKNRVPAAAPGVPRCAKCKAPLPWVVEANDENFTTVVEESTIPVLVDLWAPWCGPCRRVSPALEELARRYAGSVKLAKVNVDTSPRVSQRFGVQGIPTMLVMKGNEILARQTGAAPEPVLRDWLAKVLQLPAA